MVRQLSLSSWNLLTASLDMGFIDGFTSSEAVNILLIEKYEDEFYPIEAPNPIEAIKFRMEQMK